jgi:hypothetical protein
MTTKDYRQCRLIEYIPANPPLVRGRKYQEAVAANTTTSVRDRSGAPVVIPPPPVDQKVEVPPPAQRRNFVNPTAVGGRPTRRAD